MRNVPSLETIYRDYAPRGVQFFYLYKALAHPELNGYVTPFTLQERLLHVQEAKRRLGSQIEWLCDGMSNQAKHALGDAPNAEFVIDPEGKVVNRKAWSDPEALREFLEKTIGPVEKPTRISDLKMDLQLRPPSGKIPTGIVPRVQLPGRTLPLRIEPLLKDDGIPFYVKLRAEVQPSFFESGDSKLYLGFHLDPLYQVHWNNETPPLEFEVSAPEGVRVAPPKAAGPRVEQPADKDPREFLLDLSAEGREEPLQLAVHYFACDDANTFCVPLTQHYTIQLQRDPDGGSARRGRRPGGTAGGFQQRLWDGDQDGDGKLNIDEVPEGMRRRFRSIDSNGDGFIEEAEFRAANRRNMGPPSSAEAFLRRIREQDADGDGRISRQEAPPFLLQRFEQADSNGDGLLDQEELKALFQRMPGRRQPTQRP